MDYFAFFLRIAQLESVAARLGSLAARASGQASTGGAERRCTAPPATQRAGGLGDAAIDGDLVGVPTWAQSEAPLNTTSAARRRACG